ncbi:hypothetical protein L9F63_008804, partial [Diploptera punctata]
RWRRRWFVLRHSGELPGQYFLEYYTDRNCRKLKGKIDLDQCEQVDAGLRFENRKQKYQHMFDVKTPKRIYYLAAESEEDMNKWVEYVCHVCGLKAYKDDIEDDGYGPDEEEPATTADTITNEQQEHILGPVTESPPVSPTSTISGPYIPISECISGKSLPPKLGDTGESAGYYDSPRKLHPPNLELRQSNGSPPRSPTTDGESVFTDEECSIPVHRPPSVNWETFPNVDGENVRQTRPSDSSAEVDMGSSADIGSWSVVKRFGKLQVVDNVLTVPLAPPRPPKPFHLLLEAPSHNYLNLENVSPQPRNRRNPPSPLSPVQNNDPPSGDVNDEMYDFPRSHQYINNPSPSALSNSESKIQATRHCYTNAAPTRVNGEVFRYDFHHNDNPLSLQQEGVSTNEEPISPHSDGSSSLASNSTAAIYSNLPSPLTTQGLQSGTDSGYGGVPTPPVVNRGLKPGRKLSDSTSVVSNEPSPVSPATLPVSGNYPPSVDRKLKPHLKQMEQEPLSLAAPPACRPGSENNRSLRRNRAAPSPTPPTSTTSTLKNGQRQRSEHNSSSDDDHINSPDDEPIGFFFEYVASSAPGRQNISHGSTRFEDLQYLDLDLEKDATNDITLPPQVVKSPERLITGTVYKTVDFVKTEAFNRTRQEVEKDRL